MSYEWTRGLWTMMSYDYIMYMCIVFTLHCRSLCSCHWNKTTVGCDVSTFFCSNVVMSLMVLSMNTCWGCMLTSFPEVSILKASLFPLYPYNLHEHLLDMYLFWSWRAKTIFTCIYKSDTVCLIAEVFEPLPLPPPPPPLQFLNMK